MKLFQNSLTHLLLAITFASFLFHGSAGAQSTLIDNIPGFQSVLPMLQTPRLRDDLFDAEKQFRVLEFPETAPRSVCCQIDDGVPFYSLRAAQECPWHLIASDDLCRAKPFDCCCLDDDGPGTEGTWGTDKNCSKPLCSVHVLVDADAGLCRVPLPQERLPRLKPSAFTIGLAQRLENLNRKPSPGIGTSTQALCDASQLKPGEPCWDTIGCGIDKNGMVNCEQCTGGGTACGPLTCSKNPDGTSGPCAAPCWSTKRVCRKASPPVKYRNAASCHFKAENATDAAAKAFFDLSKGNLDAHNKMVRVMDAITQYTKYIEGRETILIPLISGGIRPNRCPDTFDDGQGGTVTLQVDCEKLTNSKCLFDDIYIFSQAAHSIPDTTMKKHVQGFLEGAMAYINLNLITDLGDLANDMARGKQEIAKRENAYKALINHVNNTMRPYVQANP